MVFDIWMGGNDPWASILYTVTQGDKLPVQKTQIYVVLANCTRSGQVETAQGAGEGLGDVVQEIWKGLAEARHETYVGGRMRLEMRYNEEG